ncbi:MAG TPA: DUF4956 domain-containing protein [Bacillota bacterium]|nr:DUF4956 domain-containing protein [Bacillota bacterium]
MTNFIADLQKLADMSSRVTIIEAFASIILSFILTFIIAVVYRKTHTGARYSQTFVQTIVIMGVVVSVIMIVIGNNIAVAFGLVGAFSIIRFRSAMSDPKDIAFIFLGMAAGITSGLGYYAIAILFTLSVILIIYFMYAINFGKAANIKKRLTITVPENLHDEEIFNTVLARHLHLYALRTIRTTSQGTMIELEYVIQNKRGVKDKDLMDDIRQINANLNVSINYLSTEVYY